jgi:hypothetical protein
MFAYPGIPTRSLPAFDGPELHVHAHRTRPGITLTERDLAVVAKERIG